MTEFLNTNFCKAKITTWSCFLIILVLWSVLKIKNLKKKKKKKKKKNQCPKIYQSILQKENTSKCMNDTFGERGGRWIQEEWVRI